MLSLISGHLMGVSKRVDPFIVRMDPSRIRKLSELMAAVLVVLDDTWARRNRKSVLLMAYSLALKTDDQWNFENADGTNAGEEISSVMSRALRTLAKRGVTLVTSSGNDGLVRRRHPRARKT